MAVDQDERVHQSVIHIERIIGWRAIDQQLRDFYFTLITEMAILQDQIGPPAPSHPDIIARRVAKLETMVDTFDRQLLKLGRYSGEGSALAHMEARASAARTAERYRTR